jgi:hypothetical protein
VRAREKAVRAKRAKILLKQKMMSIVREQPYVHEPESAFVTRARRVRLEQCATSEWRGNRRFADAIITTSAGHH